MSFNDDKRKFIGNLATATLGAGLAATYAGAQAGEDVHENIKQVIKFNPNPSDQAAFVSCHSCVYKGKQSMCNRWQISVTENSGCMNGQNKGKLGFIEATMQFRRPIENQQKSGCDTCLHQSNDSGSSCKLAEVFAFSFTNDTISLQTSKFTGCNHHTSSGSRESYNLLNEYKPTQNANRACGVCKNYQQDRCRSVAKYLFDHNSSQGDLKVTPNYTCIQFIEND